jgi:hypothetical protein
VVTIKMIGGDDREIGEKKKYGGQNTAWKPPRIRLNFRRFSAVFWCRGRWWRHKIKYGMKYGTKNSWQNESQRTAFLCLKKGIMISMLDGKDCHGASTIAIGCIFILI